MKTFKLIGMALLAIVMSFNFTACSSDNDPQQDENNTTDLSKAIIGTWVQDGDDDILVVKSDGTMTWYEDEKDYKAQEISCIYTWSIKNNWLKGYWEDKLEIEARPAEITKDKIIWKDYESLGEYSDSYGKYRLWTWERYTK